MIGPTMNPTELAPLKRANDAARPDAEEEEEEEDVGEEEVEVEEDADEDAASQSNALDKV